MIRDARLKKDMSYNQNYSKENFSQLQVRMDIFILYLIIIDSYGVTQSKPISTDPKTNQFCMFGLLRLPLYKN